MKIVALLAMSTAAALSVVPAAAQNGRVYMTGASDPWDSNSNDNAMDAAFGAGTWTKFNGFDASVLNENNKFVFFDGSDNNGLSFATFVNTNRGAIENFVTNGGRVLSNMATNNGPLSLNLGFGSVSTYPAFGGTATLTSAGLTADLDANGAGEVWTGNSFNHNIVTGGTCYILSNVGCAFAGGLQGNGAFFTGGKTTANFHSAGGQQLLVNQLKLVDTTVTAAVPEPATWAMMFVGFGMIGATARYRRRATKIAYA